MASNNVILTDDGKQRCMEQLQKFFHGDKRELKRAIEKALKSEPLSEYNCPCPSRQTIDRYFRDHSKSEKGLSLLRFRIITYVLWDIEPGSDEEHTLEEICQSVADLDEPKLEMKRTVVAVDSSSSTSEKDDVGSDVPQELPTLDVQPIGRETVLEEIHQALAKTGRVVVTGMPGVGKSLIALRYGYQEIQNYIGGVYWIDVGKGDISLDIVELAIAQGVVVPDTIALSKQLRYCTKHWPLSPEPVLLVLDNVDTEEHLYPVLRWLPVERFKLLITARPQMRLANTERVAVPVLSTDTAVSIFRQILPAQDQRLTETEALSTLCGELLGGLPLALQIVGRALKEMPYLEIAELNQQLRAVGNPFAGTELTDVDMADMLESVKQGVMAVFEISWQAISAEEQRLAGLISLYAPVQVPLILIQAAAENVDGLQSPAAACAKLLQMSLLKRTGKQSFQMHRLLRSFFQLKTQSFSDVQHAAYQALLDICRKVPQRCNQLEAKDFVAIEPHVIDAIEQGMRDRELYQSLQCYFVGQGLYRQAYLWSEQALEHHRQATDTDPTQVAYWLKQAGERAHLSALYVEALSHLEEARSLLRNMEPSKLLAEVLVILAAAQRGTGDNDKAVETSAEALELSQQYFEPDSLEMAEARLTHITSLFTQMRDQHPPVAESNFAALEEDVRKIVLVRQQRSPDAGSSLAEAYNLLAKILEKTSRPEEAISLYRKAVELIKPPHVDAASARNNLAKIIEDQADEAEVVNLYHEAISIFADADMQAFQGWCSKNLGVYYAKRGRNDKGIALVEQGCSLLQEAEHPWYEICKDTLKDLRKRNT